MIYYFVNIVFYLIILLFLIDYFKNNMNCKILMVLVFNINVFTIFIYKNINFLYGFVVIIMSLILYFFTDLFNKNNEEIILIKDGNINFHELVNNYSYKRLLNYLKIRHIKLDEIAFCILKNNQLTIIKTNF